MSASKIKISDKEQTTDQGETETTIQSHAYNLRSSNMTTTAFALTLGQIEADKIVDMNSKVGRELYKKAIQPPKVPFDGDSKKINMFQSQLLRKVETYGWDVSTGNILTIPDTENKPKNFITEYGYLTKTNLVLNAADFVGMKNRKAQNNHMMVECMLASIDEAYFYKISNEHEKYTVQYVKVASLLYKLLMAKTISIQEPPLTDSEIT